MKSKIFKYLYGLLVLVPALAVFSTCAYVALNKNSNESYSDNISITNIAVNDGNSLIASNNYTLLYVDNSETNYSPTFYYDSDSLDFTLYGWSDGINYTHFRLRGDGYIYVYDEFDNSYIQQKWGTDIKSLNFDLISVSNAININQANSQIYLTTIVKGTLDNAFYHSMEVVENNQLFSWVKGNFLYDAMNNFADIFNAKDTFLSFYFAYVLTMSLIYLAFEVLMLFINMARNLINAIQRKEW